MANIKITELNAAGSLAANDVLPVVDISTDETKKITSTNLFRTLPDGTAAAPALAFSSDQANGIYLAGTDTVGITTGGTQRVTVDASGNVVISGDLTVQGATTTVESTTVTIDDKNIELGSVASPSNTTADGGGITLKGASDKTIKWINSTGCWTFNQPTNFNDHVRIDSSGNVGIGTSSPTTNLEINGGTNNNIVRIVSTDANANIEFADNTTTSGCQIGANGDNLKFGISGSEAMRLDSSGRLLVGTSSARTNFFNSTVTAPFQIEGAGTSDRGISVVSSAIETGRGGMLVLAHQKSGAVGGNTILSSGDQVGLITFQGSDGSEFVPAARIAAEVDGTPGSNDMPGRLVFSTTADGASSASERLRIDSSGKVGIGTSSPGTKLDILGGSDASVIVTVNGQDASSEYLGLGINAGAAVITAGGNGSTSNALVFKTAPSGTETERLRITSDGKLGLGTTSPGRQLTLSHASQAEIGLLSGADTSGALIYQNASEQKLLVANRESDGHIAFQTGGANERLRIDSSGKVGIGTSSPAELLHLKSDTPYIRFEDDNDNQDWNIEARSFFGINDVTNNAFRFVIDGSGKVGIGTTSPSTELHVAASSGYAELRLAGASGSGSSVEFYESTTKRGDIYIDPSSNIVFRNNTERLRIDSSGNVFIGGTTAASADIALNANGSASFSGNVTVQDGVSGVSTSASDALTIETSDVTSKTRGIGIYGKSSIPSTYEAFQLYYNGSQNVTIKYDGSASFAGNVGIGTASPAYQLDVQGSGNSRIRVKNTSVSGEAQFHHDGNGDLFIKNSVSGRNLSFVNNGSERLRIDSSGNVNIGTTAAASYSQLTLRAASPQLSLYATPGNVSCLNMGDTDDNDIGQIVYSNSDNSMRFVANNAERMRIDSSGNVGIGSGANIQLTASGRKTLALNGNSENVISFSHSDTLAAFFYTSSTEFRMQSEISVPLVFRPNNSEAMRLDTSGRLGIGVTTMAGGSSSVTILRNSALRWADSNGTQRADIYGDSSSNLVFRNGTGSTERMRIDSSGNVSIGTTSGSFSQFGSNTGGLAVEDVGGTNTGIKIGDGTNDNYLIAAGNGSFYQSHYGSGHMIFGVGTSGTERMRIRSDGRMLVPGVYAETTGGAENVNVQSDGLMQRSVSSIKYKKDVETLEDSYADALLDLRPVWYKSKCASDNPDWGYWGFIAEELAEIDPRLVIWKTEEVTADEDGNQVKTACDPEPEGVQYSRFVPHLLNLIKRQQTAIETLETKVAALEAG